MNSLGAMFASGWGVDKSLRLGGTSVLGSWASDSRFERRRFTESARRMFGVSGVGLGGPIAPAGTPIAQIVDALHSSFDFVNQGYLGDWSWQ